MDQVPLVKNERLVVTDAILLDDAIGSIDPDTRINAKELNGAKRNEFIERVRSGEFFDEIEAEIGHDELAADIPAKCVDGRKPKKGSSAPAPNAAGGTTTVIIGDALSSVTSQPKYKDVELHTRSVLSELKAKHRVGGHDADVTHGENTTGCKAEDELPEILEFIHSNGDVIRRLMRQLGVEDVDEYHQSIIEKAGQLIADGYVLPNDSPGQRIRQAFITEAGEASVETLTGPHYEVAVILNFCPNTTLDRDAIEAEFGEDRIQAFNVDVWALENAAKVTSLTEREARQMFIAELYYNLGTACVIAGPSMQVITRRNASS